MSMIKKVSLLLPALLLFSCSRVDKHSSIGADIIAQIDSSAVVYDGVFNTDSTLPGTKDWIRMTDSLSGLHRYKDYIKKGNNGALQHKMTVGRFADEEAFVYTTFSHEYDIDTSSWNKDSVPLLDTTILRQSIGWYVDSLLGLQIDSTTIDSISTALVLYSDFEDTNKQVKDYYNLEFSAIPYVKDSMRVDTSKRVPLNTVLFRGIQDTVTVDLPFHYYQADEGDTLETIKIVTGEKTKEMTLLATETLIMEGAAPVIDTQFNGIVNDTFAFNSSDVKEYYEIISIDTNTVFDSLGNFFYNYEALDTIPHPKDASRDTIVTITVTKEIEHSYSPVVDTLGDTTYVDSLVFPDTTYSVSDTVIVLDTFKVDGTIDTIITKTFVYDTLFTVADFNVVQIVSYENLIVSYESRYAYDSSDIAEKWITELDTMSILVKDITDREESLFPIDRFDLKFYVHKTRTTKIDGVPSTKPIKDSLFIKFANRTNMIVFDKGAPIATAIPRISGGLEEVSVLTVNSVPFWNTVLKNNYLSIVQAQIEIPISELIIPDYADSAFQVRAILTDKHHVENTAALLGDTTSLYSTYGTVNMEDSTVTLDLQDYFVDLRYEKLVNNDITPAATYLYLWIDGSQMGQITFNRLKPYMFTYIVQNKQK